MAHPLIDGARPGDVIALVGPNGAGKSTLLRAIAADTADVGLVFQDRLLFPHMTALDNVAFGLRRAGVRKTEARAQARDWLARLGVIDVADRRPHALSGGEAQRVAVARALARGPRVLLLDEPFAAVDVEAAAAVRRAIREAAAPDRVTVLVTHQPVEVLALANTVAVMEAGVITQTGTVDDVRTRPRSPWVARMVGLNLLKGVASEHGIDVDGVVVAALTDVRGDAFAVVHPHAVTLSNERPLTSARNAWPGRAVETDFEGDRVRVKVDGAVELVAEITRAAYAELGTDVWASVKATEVDVFPA